MFIQADMQASDGMWRYCPRGEVSLVVAVEMVTDAIAYCSDRKIEKVLIDLRDLHGYSVPTLIDRFLMAHDWAQASRGAVTVALVAQEKYIHPAKFGVRVATDAGMRADVFTSDVEAQAWLASGGQSDAGRGDAPG